MTSIRRVTTIALLSASDRTRTRMCFRAYEQTIVLDRPKLLRQFYASFRSLDFTRRSLSRVGSLLEAALSLPLTRPSTSAWLSDERGNVGRTRQGGSCGRARARTCARGRAGRSRRPPCGGDTCHGGDPNLCSTSAAACCADACNGHFRRTDACRPAGPGPPTGTPGSSTCSINLCSTRATPDPPRWPAWPSAPTL